MKLSYLTKIRASRNIFERAKTLQSIKCNWKRTWSIFVIKYIPQFHSSIESSDTYLTRPLAFFSLMSPLSTLRTHSIQCLPIIIIQNFYYISLVLTFPHSIPFLSLSFPSSFPASVWLVLLRCTRWKGKAFVTHAIHKFQQLCNKKIEAAVTSTLADLVFSWKNCSFYFQNSNSMQLVCLLQYLNRKSTG